MARIIARSLVPVLLAGAALAQSPHNPRSFSRAGGARRTVFVRNGGQAPADVSWQAVGAGFEAAFSRDGFTLTLAEADAQAGAPAWRPAASGARAAAFIEQRISFVNANPGATIEALDPQAGKVSFFRGRDRTRWASGLTTYARLRYTNLYPGIDLLFYARAGSLEYDFVVAAGADPGRIRLRAEDGRPVHITPGGALQVGEGAEAVLHQPVLYQNLGQGKQAVEGRFARMAGDTIGFQFGHYNRARPLVIDPSLSLLYSTYFGGPHDDEAQAIALDAQNNAYILGYSGSEDYPVSGNAYQPVRQALGRLVTNMVITKVSAAGALLYSTFLGGTTDDGGATTIGAIAVDAGGHAYITSRTQSADFPVTGNAYMGTFPTGASTSAFVSEISPDGSTLLYSSFFGGAGGASGTGIGLNPQGNLTVGGTAGPGLPTTSTAYLKQIASGTAAFVAVFNPALSGTAQLLASTYYGAATPTANNTATGNTASAMALDSAGDPWIAGQSYTGNLPTTGGAYQATIPALSPSCSGGVALNSVAYFAKLSADLTSLDYASYLSGKTAGPNSCSEYAHAITVDASGSVYIAGSTASPLFPTTAGVLQATDPTSDYAEFVSKVSADGTQLLWSTYLGGNGNSFQDAIALDSQNNVWVSGTTQGGFNFPLANAYQTAEGGGYDGHITQIKSDGTAALFSTYLGGSGDDIAAALAVDAQDNVYIAGYTNSRNFPLTANALQPVFANGDTVYDGNDIFFTVLGSGVIGAISPAVGGNTGDTTITVGGAGFQAGATCSLVQGLTTIQASAVNVSTDGSTLSCTFGLNGAATGSYSLVVNSPGSATVTQTNAFTVTSGGQPQIWTNVVGRSKIRDGAPSTFTVSVGNSGTADAYFTVLWIAFPATLSYSLTQPLIDPTDPLGTDYSMANATEDSSGNTVMKFILAHLPPNSTVSIGIALTAAVDTSSIQIQSYTYRPWYDSYATASSELTAAMNGGVLSTTCTPNAAKDYLNDCIGPEIGEVSQDVLDTLQAQNQITGDPAVALLTLEGQYAGRLLFYLNQSATGESGQTMATIGRQTRPRDLVPSRIYVVNPGVAQTAIGSQQYKKTNTTKGCIMASAVIKPCCSGKATVDLILKCPGGVLQDLGNWVVPCDKHGNPQPPQACPAGGGSSAAGKLLRLNSMLHPLRGSLLPREGESCSADDSDGEGGASGEGGSCSSSGGSIDPNDKSGPRGDGSAAQYVRVAPLTYNVAFENQPTATLPASKVVVTDPLDATKLDLNTVTLQSISFGSAVINLPSGTGNFDTTLSITSSLSLRIQGSLNTDTGLLTWTFTSLDPSTGLPPSDPTVGFLPPDADGVEGQGAVVFSVTPKSTLATGTEVTNQATVVFDTNAPILTPTWLNTMDVTAPTSAVTTLSATQTATPFTVSWSGSDIGSGITSYAIWVSDNSGPFTQWMAQTSAASAVYYGQPGHTYGFYSIATDGVGNIQAAKTVADSTTTVGAGVLTVCDFNQSAATVADVQLLVNQALGAQSPANDVNADGTVDVVDIQVEINALLNLGCVPH